MSDTRRQRELQVCCCVVAVTVGDYGPMSSTRVNYLVVHLLGHVVSASVCFSERVSAWRFSSGRALHICYGLFFWETWQSSRVRLLSSMLKGFPPNWNLGVE